LVVGIIVLFIGLSSASALNNDIINFSNMVDDVKESSKYITIFHPDDANIAHNSPNNNYGGGPEIGIRNDYGIGGTSGWANDGLIKFNLSKLPAGSTIKSAKLYLYYYRWQDNYPAGRELNLYRITSDWDEDTVTWNTAPSYNQTPTANSSVPSSVNIWMEWNVKSDVKDFVLGTPNYGWRLIDDNYWGFPNIPLVFFRTKEFSHNLSSYLKIEYTTSRNKNVNHPHLEYYKQIPNILSLNKDTSDSEEDCIECQSNGKTHLAEKLLSKLEKNELLSNVIDLDTQDDRPICIIFGIAWLLHDALAMYFEDKATEYSNNWFKYRLYTHLYNIHRKLSEIYFNIGVSIYNCDFYPY
jgi:hypothetical protein